MDKKDRELTEDLIKVIEGLDGPDPTLAEQVRKNLQDEIDQEKH